MISIDEGLLHNFFERLFARLAEQSTASMDVETISKLVQIVYEEFDELNNMKATINYYKR